MNILFNFTFNMFIIGCDYKHNCKLLVKINQLTFTNETEKRESQRKKR